MKLKMIIVFLVLLPVLGFSQIRFVDTVTVSGYFYDYQGKYHKTFWLANGLFAPYFRFVPESTLQRRTFIDHVKFTTSKEKDTVKFLSCQVHEEFGAYETADESVKPWIAKVKEIKPFYVGQKAYPCGIKDNSVCISYVNMQWLHLRMPGTVACDGFNLPITFDCWDKAKTHDYDVYLPLKLLELEQGIKLKKGKLVHPKKRKLLNNSL